MSFNTKRTAIMTTLLLVGAGFVFVGSASADHVYESPNTLECDELLVFPGAGAYVWVTRTCVADTDSGDRSDCPEGPYKSETQVYGWGVWAGGGLVYWTDAYVNPTFSGAETCDSSGYEASVTANHFTYGLVKDTSASASHGWNQHTIDLSASLDGNSVHAEWGGDECITILDIDDDPVVEEGCPAGGPPGAPNPGWGHLTPATP